MDHRGLQIKQMLNPPRRVMYASFRQPHTRCLFPLAPRCNSISFIIAQSHCAAFFAAWPVPELIEIVFYVFLLRFSFTS